MSVKGFGDDFRLTLLTDDPAVAAIADRSGVDRIEIDLECLGKTQRQSGFDTRLSNHRVEALPAVARSLTRAKLFVRVNPINADTADEVEAVLRCGARVVMLPYFRTASEVETFVGLINGRASAMLLLETASSVVRIREILEVPGVSEVMVGLNDLRLELGVQNHFEVLPLRFWRGSPARSKKRIWPFQSAALRAPMTLSFRSLPTWSSLSFHALARPARGYHARSCRTSRPTVTWPKARPKASKPSGSVSLNGARHRRQPWNTLEGSSPNGPGSSREGR